MSTKRIWSEESRTRGGKVKDVREVSVVDNLKRQGGGRDWKVLKGRVHPEKGCTRVSGGDLGQYTSIDDFTHGRGVLYWGSSCTCHQVSVSRVVCQTEVVSLQSVEPRDRGGGGVTLG